VWRHSKTKEIKVVGSVDELLTMVRRSGNNYFLMRHGEAQSTVEGIINSDNSIENHLTEDGKIQVRANISKLKGKEKIDLIIASPLTRAHETAMLVQQELGLPDSSLMVDERLREIGSGIYNGKSLAEWMARFASTDERFATIPEGGESYMDVRRRVGDFLFEIERRYSGKKILIISHGSPLWILSAIAACEGPAVAVKREDMFGLAEIAETPFVPYPHNDDFELDLHRPYIDDIPLGNSLEGEWKRVPDVFDCWFESGSMPYASNHYPFKKENFNPKKLFGFMPKGYPADFIAEGLDQTRGWFYSLIVLGTALFGKSPYEHVIVNGLINASDGKKMSKRLKNYPDPLDLIDKYGVDSLRYYLLSSQLVRGEDLSFKEQGVEEVSKKLLMRLDNVVSFYELYANETARSSESTSALDRWIVSRLGELMKQTTEGFEKYELDAATRPLAAFIDDLSTWYLRRSRDRFKTDGEEKTRALSTLRYVLYILSHAMAPVMPFFSDELFGRVKEEGDVESVHLSRWPDAGNVDEQLLKDMKRVREIASRGLELREAANMKIRQPLAELKAKTLPADDELRAIIADELHVKKVSEDVSLSTDVWLDTELTPALKEEGIVRDIVRKIQGWRKEQNLQISDRAEYTLAATEEEKSAVEKNRTKIMEQTGLSALNIE